MNSKRAVLGVTSGSYSRSPKFLWTPEIAELRRDCIRTRRKLTRTNKRTTATQEDKSELGTRFADTQKNLREAIKSSKRACWERHLAELNVDPWGTAFRVATGKTRRRQKVDADIQRKVADELFPIHEVVQFPDLPDYEAPTPFSPEELWQAIGKIKPGKAPGPDEVSPKVTRAVCLHFPDRCLKMFNDCLTRDPEAEERAIEPSHLPSYLSYQHDGKSHGAHSPTQAERGAWSDLVRTAVRFSSREVNCGCP